MATATKMRLTGILTNSYDNPLANAVIKFVCTETYLDILNTVDTEYQITATGSYDFTVNYGTYTVQIRKAEDRNYSTVMANVVVAAPGPWTIEELITQQPNIQILDPDIVEQMASLLNQAVAAAALSKDWANKAEDQKVDSTEYSSKHYSIKSSKSATAASTSASQANTAKVAAETANTAAQAAKTAAETANTNAQAAKTAAETANTSAQAAKNAAATSEANALASKNAAATSEANALASKNAAASSATSASNSASSANTSNTGAQSAKTAAETARDKAQKWADEAVDVTVEPTKFSAKHWATKASDSATQANTAKVAAETAEVAAETARDQAVAANTSAQAAKTASETARDQSVTAKNQSVTAKTASETARDQAIAAKDLAEQAAASTSGSIIENGNVDLSSGVAPAPIVINSVKRATLWKVTVGGTVNGIQYGVGDSIVYSAQTNSYFKIDSTDSVTSVAGKTGVVTLVPADVGLGNVNNTSDANKPVSTAQAAAIAAKVDKTTTVNGKPLSSNITLSNSDVGAEPAGAVASGIQALKAEADPFPIYLTEQELADSEVPFPDVWIPFNDSLQMLAGFGDYDRLYIGDKYFELPTRSVNFERSTTATYIDKSGVLRTAAINEPRFEKQGLLMEGQSTNLWPRSEGATQLWGCTNTTQASSSGWNMIRYSTDSGPGASDVSVSGDGKYTVSVTFLITGVPAKFTFQTRNGTPFTSWFGIDEMGSVISHPTSNFSSLTSTRFGDVVRVSATTPDLIGVTTIRFYRYEQFNGDTFGGIQLEFLPFSSSYIPTNGAAVTRAADKCWIGRMLNMQSSLPAGLSVALTFNKTGFTAGLSNYVVSLVDIGNDDRYGIATSDTIIPNYSFDGYGNAFAGNLTTTGGGTTLVMSLGEDGARACSVNNLLVNGTAGNTKRRVVPQGTIKFCDRVGEGTRAWGHIRNLRIWHQALSDLQIKRLK